MATDAANSSTLASSLCDHLIDALTHLRQDLSGTTPAAGVARGKVFQVAGYYEEAVDSYKKALAADPGMDEAAARLVVTQLSARNPEGALAAGTKLAQHNPSYEMKEISSDQVVSSMTLMGDALASNGRVHDAIEAYKIARKQSSKDVFAGGRLAQAYLAVGNASAAVQEISTVSKNPRFRGLASLLELGRKTEALLPKFGQSDMNVLLSHSMPGRPAFVDGAARVAEVVYGPSDWCK